MNRTIPKNLIFSGHALQKIFERNIRKEEVKETVSNGKIIAEYPEDKPFPSYLLLHFINDRPIHVVMALNETEETGIVITVYIPDIEIWNENFTKRRDTP